MSLLDLIQSSIGDSSIEQIGNKLGKDRQTTSSAIEAALPVLIGALSRSTAKDGGAGLDRALEKKHDGSILDDVAGFLGGDDESDGRGILGHVLGSRGEAAAKMLGKESGIGKSNAASLLATLAPVVLGALGKKKKEQQLGPGDLIGMLSEESSSLGQRAPSIMGALGGLLDADGDGDTDLADLAKRFLR